MIAETCTDSKYRLLCAIYGQQLVRDKMHKGIEEALSTALNMLSVRERRVLELRFGFDRDKGRTMKEVGVIYEVTGGRIGQIVAKALRKLRHPRRSRVFRPYLADSFPV